MSPEQRTILQQTWGQVVPIADSAAALFYDRLFAVDPELRPLFGGVDMARQGGKLTTALAAVIDNLASIEEMVPELQELGRRHAGYGVTDAHYRTVGSALLWTLEQGLGEAWTTEAKAAWTDAYQLVADVMRGAAADAQPAV